MSSTMIISVKLCFQQVGPQATREMPVEISWPDRLAASNQTPNRTIAMISFITMNASTYSEINHAFVTRQTINLLSAVAFSMVIFGAHKQWAYNSPNAYKQHMWKIQ
jgi:hypothetical protein